MDGCTESRAAAASPSTASLLAAVLAGPDDEADRLLAERVRERLGGLTPAFAVSDAVREVFVAFEQGAVGDCVRVKWEESRYYCAAEAVFRVASLAARLGPWLRAQWELAAYLDTK